MKWYVTANRIGSGVVYGLFYILISIIFATRNKGFFEIDDRCIGSHFLYWEYIQIYAINWSIEIGACVCILMSACMYADFKYFSNMRHFDKVVFLSGLLGSSIAVAHVLILFYVYAHNGWINRKVISYTGLDGIIIHMVSYLFLIVPWGAWLFVARRPVQKILTREKSMNCATKA